MESCKKIIPGFSCLEGQAVITSGNTDCRIEDYITLSQYYSDNGADEIFIRDLSTDDEDHERAIGMIKEIAKNTDIPVIAGGHVKRLEDVKKYLYAGAKSVFLEAAVEENIDLIKEASDRFGSEKIYVYMDSAKLLKRGEEMMQLGASLIILEEANFTLDTAEAVSGIQAPFYVVCENDQNTMATLLHMENIDGVIIRLPAEKEETPMDIKHQMKGRDIAVDTFESAMDWRDFKLNSDGMLPVVVQDYKTLEVLMVAYMNEEAFHATIRSGKMTYFSRSRQTLWLKGETSGHYQYVKSLTLDCDNDTLLAKVAQVGPACHTGARSCFFQTLVAKETREVNPLKVFEDVYSVILDRKSNPKEGSYTNYLFDKGIDKILKKIGEEATEIVIAAKNPNHEEVKYEIADFLYHMMVLMADKGLSWEEITEELANR